MEPAGDGFWNTICAMIGLKDKIQTRKVFNQKASEWAQSYFGHNFCAHNFKERRKKVLSLLDVGSGRYLDAGCGTGEFLRALSGGGGEVYAFDGAHRMVLEAKRQYGKENNIHVFVGDMERIPVRDNFFDGIICVGVLEYLPDDNASLKELYRVLRDDGILVVTLPNKLSPFMMLDQLIIYSLKSIARLLDWIGIYELIRRRKRARDGYSFHKCYIPSRFNKLIRGHKFQIVGESWCSFGSMIVSNYIPLSVKVSRFLGSINPGSLKFLAWNDIVKISK